MDYRDIVRLSAVPPEVEKSQALMVWDTFRQMIDGAKDIDHLSVTKEFDNTIVVRLRIIEEEQDAKD